MKAGCGDWEKPWAFYKRQTSAAYSTLCLYIGRNKMLQICLSHIASQFWMHCHWIELTGYMEKLLLSKAGLDG